MRPASAIPAEPNPSPNAARDASIDVVRGFVMVLMVLDHARDFLTSTAFSPTDPDRTDAALFFTRWVTHYCAPTFMLLAGVGAGLSRRGGRDARSLSWFLLTRGAWLLLLEVTWVRFGWMFDLTYERTSGQVIWALGACMIALAGLVFLPPVASVILGLVTVLGHDALDGVDAKATAHPWLWEILHTGGPIEYAPGHTFYVAYPLVPWVGVMALGYALGLVWRRTTARQLTIGGLALIAIFVPLRVSAIYGDANAFRARAGLRTIFSLLDCTKYPPSLDYLLMTIGPALVALGALRDRALGRVGDALVVFGRTPMFFYLLHLPLVHALSLPFRAWHHLPLASGPFRHGLDEPLGVAYAVAALAVAMLWLPCARWAVEKAKHPGGWRSYLLQGAAPARPHRAAAPRDKVRPFARRQCCSVSRLNFRNCARRAVTSSWSIGSPATCAFTAAYLSQ